jgi:hypothetical protein
VTPEELQKLWEQAKPAAKSPPPPEDLAALWAQAGATPNGQAAPLVGGGEAFGRGAVQGATLGLGDELQGAIQTLPDKALWLSPAGFLLGPAKALAEATSDVPADQRARAAQVDEERAARLAKEGPGARLRRALGEYRMGRDSARQENVAAKEAAPWSYGLGNLAGGAVTAPLMGGGAATAGQAALQGAKLGSAAGFGGSEADLTTGDVGQLGRAALDTGVGGALGAAAGAGAYYLPKLIGAANEKIGGLGRALATRLGRRVLQGGSETLSKGSPIPEETVMDAIRRGIIKFGSTTQGAADRATAQADQAGALYGSILDELQAAGVQGPNAHRIAAEVAQDAAKRVLMDPIGAGPPLMQRFAEKLGAQYQPGEADMPLDVAEGMKRTLQNAAAQDFRALGAGADLKSAAEGRVALADKLKTAIENAVDRQAAKAPEVAAAFQPAKAEDAALIRLRNLAQQGAGKAAKRNPVGLYDMLAGMAGGAHFGLPGVVAAPASMALRAVGPSSGAVTGAAVSELANALRGLPAAAERELPGIGRAALTAGIGGGTALTAQQRAALADYLANRNQTP